MKKLFVLLLLLAGMSFGQTTVAPFLNSEIQLLDNSGLVCSGCLLDTFAAGTTTPLATYSESTGTSLNSNPIVLSSAGRATVYLTSASYKFRLRSAAGVTLWTQDNISWVSPLSTFTGISDAGNLTQTQPTAATGGANQSSFSDCMNGTYWTGAVSATDSWCLQDILGTGTNPTSTFTLTHSGSSGAASFSVVPNASFTGTVTAAILSTPKINGVTWLDGTTNTTISGCLATACAAKSTCYVKPNYSETLAGDITVTNDCGLHFTGVAAINMGTKQFKCAGGTCNDFFIDGDIPFGSAGTPSAGAVFTYTGTTTPFSFGDTIADTFSITLRNFAVNVSGAGAAVSAISLGRLHPFNIQNVRLIGTTGQIGINMNGSGGYTGNSDILIHANGFTSCIKMTSNGSSNRILAYCANTPAAGKAIDIADGNGNVIQVDAENAPVGINFGASANTFGNRVYIYGQGNTTDATFGAGSAANTVDNVGANCTTINPTATDSGTNNTVWNPCKFKMDVNGNFTATTVQGGTTGVSGGLGAAALVKAVSSGTSVMAFESAGGPADAKWWELDGSSTDFIIRTLNDANNAAVTAIDIKRGTGTAVNTVSISPSISNGANLLISTTAPTISSGFGTSPSIPTNNGTAAFTVNVGTGGTATNGVIGLPTATNGWNCTCEDITTTSATVARCKQTASSTTTATIGNFNTTPAAAAWVASDIVAVNCSGR